MQKILIVDDETDIAQNIATYISTVEPSMVTVISHDGFDAFSLAATDPTISLVLLDVGLPDIDGMNVCSRLRNIGWTNPIIMLTAHDTESDKVRGLESGADDYVVKPFSLAELMARIRAQLRRSERISPKQVFDVAGLRLNQQTREVTRDGIPVKLNATTFKILALLMKRCPAVVTHEELAKEVWPESSPSSDTIRSHMYLLRNAIDKPFKDKNPLLVTLAGIGWKLDHQ